ncbi:hypothetical protein ACRE_006220 [Hapsidospora chrysogenum ATCC 11550]|uniref:Uncharacterized protein n=1 Tax=Hapsidospora chrysogenum (strain ATCC 11550 / CBS 779.69 / DSM 880 / IAM 14645 / JCM 23072 / IMI 49137) TaxID=857340 RepID=A0A086TGH0_HAPC1|nr:hypothetical protein ACRE_006220 [Hapsidospora chrysogenum ATCC 11550]
MYNAEPSRYTPDSWRRPQMPTHILVENHTDGSLRRRYGSRFPLAITKDTTTNSILSFLAPDPLRYKVVVYWNDNTKETLEEWISTTELRQHASHLEVKKKKRVHFA